MAERNYLAFDLGAESGRAVLGRLAGGKLTLEEKHRFPNPNGRINGHLHWNLLGQWEELKTGLRKTVAGTNIELHGIGVDTWGVDFGLVAKNGEILGNPFHYRDTRTEGLMERTFQRVPKEQIFQATGVQFMEINSLFQLIAMRLGSSPLLDSADTLLFVPDLFNFLFTGIRKSEFSIASTSQMYDPRQKNWATEMLKALDLPVRIFPEIIPSGTILGPLRDDVAAECGAGPIPVIAPATHDTASAVAAVPTDSSSNDWCYISSGTWSLMGVEIPQPLINDKALKYNYTNEGGVGGTIRFLKNIAGLWPVQECRRFWKREGHDHTYGELTHMAARARPLVSLLNLAAKPFLAPGEMPIKIEQFCRETNQPLPSARGEYIRACLDSLALTYRQTLEGLEDVLGRKIAVIHIVGGGCQNELLNQMTADACKRPVIAGPIEATGIGNILVQAMATGDVKSLADARAIVRASFDVKRYEPRDAGKWDEAYGRFKGL
ncbi:MAG TPA: rhamnulokinase family protein [Tepidisphaeraceae bacterium]|jgi:rhamnulokinase|nr:rhamnulokinase family protein [Tepidisphaeraceae bacterium]